MRIAAYQAPLLPSGSMEALDLIRQSVESCETHGVALLCCPEAILGGLADDSPDPAAFALAAGQLEATLEPIASDTVTSIVGFTERAAEGRLYNSVAILQRGYVVGVYRKLHPALRRSVYEPGTETPVFQVGALTFGIVICNDSNFDDPARRMAELGATVLFVPSNNGLPPAKGGAPLVAAARKVDVRLATAHHLWVIRADVAGRVGERVSFGSSAIVDPSGTVVQSARELTEDLIVADIEVPPRGRR